MRPKTFKLHKQTSSKELQWEITVQDCITTVKAGGNGQKTKVYPEMEHDSPKAAFRFTQNQIMKKKKAGYEEISPKSPGSKLRPPPSNQHDDEYEEPPKPSNSSKRTKGAPQDDLRKVLHKKRYKETQEETQEETQDEMQETQDIDNDTDSVASSTSTIKTGVSPLNRRRVKLKLKPGESEMDAATAPPLLSRVSTTYFLRSQLAVTTLDRSETVEMSAVAHGGGPAGLQRMETVGRWENWREEKPATGPQKPTVVPSPHTTTKPYPAPTNARANPQGKDVYGKLLASLPNNTATSPPKLTRTASKTSEPPQLTKKKSTTADLRLAVANQDLSDNPSTKPSSLHISVPKPGIRLKRKATTLLSPIAENGETGQGSGTGRSKGLKKGPSKKVLIQTPDEAPSKRRPGPPKRQSTLILDSNQVEFGHKSKKLCTSAPLHDGSSGSDGLMYVPGRADWPVTVPAPVVWSVPLLTSDGRPLQGTSLYVDRTRALVGVDDGSVLELDPTVTPSGLYKLPSGVRCLRYDEGFVYAGCENRGLYDITNPEARLVSQIKGFGQLLSVAVCGGRVAVSDDQGNVATVDHAGDIYWRQRSDGEFGWMVSVDDSLVYHGHSCGVTAYSVTDGQREWSYTTTEPVLHGVEDTSHLYVAVGPLVQKIEKTSGKVVATYDKGKSHTTVIHSLALTDDFIIAGGKKIVVYDLESAEVVYVLKLDFKPSEMQYFQGRLLCTGPGQLLAIDLTETSIIDAMAGHTPAPVIVSLESRTTTQRPPLPRPPTITKAASVRAPGVVIECVKPAQRKGKLLVRAVSKVDNASWDVQLSPDFCRRGARFIVQELRPCPGGQYYRVYGDIKEVE